MRKYFLYLILIGQLSVVGSCSVERDCWNLQHTLESISSKYAIGLNIHERNDTLVYRIDIDSARINARGKVYLLELLILKDSYLENKENRLCFKYFNFVINIKNRDHQIASIYSDYKTLYDIIYVDALAPELIEMKNFLWNNVTSKELEIYEEIYEYRFKSDSVDQPINFSHLVESYVLNRLAGVVDGRHEKTLKKMVILLNDHSYYSETIGLKKILAKGYKLEPRMESMLKIPEWDDDYDLIREIQNGRFP